MFQESTSHLILKLITSESLVFSCNLLIICFFKIWLNKIISVDSHLTLHKDLKKKPVKLIELMENSFRSCAFLHYTVQCAIYGYCHTFLEKISWKYICTLLKNYKMYVCSWFDEIFFRESKVFLSSLYTVHYLSKFRQFDGIFDLGIEEINFSYCRDL